MSWSFKQSRQRMGCALLSGLLFLISTAEAQNVPPRKFAVQVTVQTQESPPQLVLNWPNEGDASSYVISRRTLDSDWQPLGSLSGEQTSLTDTNINLGTKYEYQIIKYSTGIYTGYGYISAGIRIPVVDQRGKLILLAENALAGAMTTEIEKLKSDLTGDGWVVLFRTASANDSPQTVKETIRGLYEMDPTAVRAVFLLGHIPVPYSGNFMPDGHLNHQGAWPADAYYADMDGIWTDLSVRSTNAERQVNWNLPRDGKFDQSNLPSSAELMVGRVDLSNLTSFSNKAYSRSELDLMRQYLAKNRAFRFGEMAIKRRGLICDNFSDKGADPIGNSAWRNFAGFFGPTNITEVGWNEFFPTATKESYLWSYASGGGSYYYSQGVGTSDDFALQDLKIVFAMFMGSYFGDWNNESNFLRASLGSGSILTATYSGFPHTLYFPMALGEPIGYSIRLTQNNATNSFYPPWNQGAGQVHIALLGDPTLRMHPVRPARDFTATSGTNGIQLNWKTSPEEIVGYHVYRSAKSEGPYSRITSAPTLSTALYDRPGGGTFTYMVRAVKLEQTPSGSYLNLSQGLFATGTSTSTNSPPPLQPPVSPTLRLSGATFDSVRMEWNDVANETGYKLERKEASGTWSEVGAPGENSTAFTDRTVLAATEYLYRVRALNSAGYSAYSAEIPVTTPAAPVVKAQARFVELNSTTLGNWANLFGSTGFAVAGLESNLPELSLPNNPVWTWDNTPADIRAPLRTRTVTNRIASAWFGDRVITTLSLSGPRRLALYFLDWDAKGRAQSVTITDTETGQILDTRKVADFSDGKYLVYEVDGTFTITLGKEGGPNAVLSAVLTGGPEITPISDRPLNLDLNATSSSLVLRVSGDSGQKFKVFSSEDLRSWTEVSNGVLTDGSMEIPISISQTRRQLYFRTMNYR